MRIATCTVTYEGSKKEKCNKKRLNVAELALKTSRALGAQVLILPGGYFTTRTPQARGGIALSLINTAKKMNIAIAFGVYQIPKYSSKNWKREIWEGELPWYGYAWSPAENVKNCWTQRYLTRKDQSWCPDKLCNEVRTLKIGKETLGILICGEMFNNRIRQALAKYRPKIKVVADVAHYSEGFRIFAGMKVLAEKYGIASVCSVHTQRRSAQKFCYLPQKGDVGE